MIMLLITVFVVGATTYLWVTRGFMSALIHMVCVIAAGAIAFGVWEPLSLFLLSKSPERGFASGLSGVAWGLGLALPFAASLALLRVAIDSLLPGNAQCHTAVDYVGGGICGFVSGVISAGIIVLSIGLLRLQPEFWGHTPIVYTSLDSRGSMERPRGNLMVPWVDRITASIYSQLSLTTLRTNSPLAVWHPDFDTFPAALRYTYEGSSRTTLKPQDFNVVGWYNVGNPQQPGDLTPLLSDAWNDVPQRITDLDGNRITQGYLTGLVVEFRASARERTGVISVGNAQVRLVAQREGEDESIALHPVAVVTRTNDPVEISYARFRFDSDNMFVASVGGEADATMGFEFAVPAGYKPLALYVKGIRYTLHDKQPSRTFETTRARDQVVREGKLAANLKPPGPILDHEGRPMQRPDDGAQWRPDPVQVSPALPFIIQKGGERGLTVAQLGRGWVIEDGQARFSHAEIARNHGLDFKLQINRFATTEDTVMIRIDLSPSNRDAAFARNLEVADRNAPPQLIDANGRPYPAVGYLFDDGSLHEVRYTRGQPVRRFGDLPAVSRNNPDRKLQLLFIVSKGVTIREFRIGGTVMERYDPPLETEQNR